MEILKLESEKKILEKEALKYKENLDQLNKNSSMNNARGAGRKSKLSDAQIDDIKKLREDGNTIKEIASRYDCSVGLVYKLINEK